MVPTFDPDAIARIRKFGGDPLLHEMIDLLLAGAPPRLETVRAAIAQGDASTARGALHSLKSSSGQMGAVALQAVCERGERLAAEGDVAAVAAMLPDLSDAFEAAARWLRDARNGGT
ncbi:MAG: Hpt domain-containing protein [Gemmatimonadaceae bacterium]|nr:Hpt domain-containing protein [Gemmatimonadaceae bacterium]